MTAEKIILKYQEKGVKLFLNEDKLQFSGPKGIIDDDARKELQAYKDDIITYLKSHKGQVVCDKTQRFLPFEMTDIQVAYVIGRNRTYQYGGIGCKIYAEYEFPKLDLEKLERAWENVVKNNDMLHAVIKNNKEQQILQDYEVPAIEKWKIEDISPDERKNKLNEIRDRLVMKQYKVGEWPLFDLEISELEDVTILHISLDMLIADFLSINIIVDELEDNYFGDKKKTFTKELSFRDVIVYEHNRQKHPQYSETMKKDKQYWEERISTMPEAPDLPVKEDLKDTSIRQLNTYIEKERYLELQKLADDNNITLSGLILACYAEVLAYWSNSKRFSINVTMANREQVHPDIYSIIGDFTKINILEICQDYNLSFIQRVQFIQKQLWNDMEHMSYSGIEVLREMTRLKKKEVIIPYVFTSTLSMVSRKESTNHKGNLIYKISQTPQVLIDCQVMEYKEGILVNWDVREKAFPKKMIEMAFRTFSEMLIYTDTQNMLADKNVIKLPSDMKEIRKKKEVNYPYIPQLLHEGFCESVKKYPSKIALCSNGKEYGVIEFLGREDYQVKIRGHRVELNEVESVINQCEDVEGSIVVTATENDDIIGAFVQPKIEKSVVDNTAEINDIKNKNKSFNQDSNLFEANVLDFADWLHASNETAIYDMLATFYKVEIFTDRNTWYPIKEIFNSLKVHEYYEPLIRRWLKALETEGYVVKNDKNQYRIKKEITRDLAEHSWEQWLKVDSKVHYNDLMMNFFGETRTNLLPLLRGKLDPIDLFFPKGSFKVALAAYKDNIVSKCTNRVVVEDMLVLVKHFTKKYPQKQFRILEIGAGVGGVSIDLIEALKIYNVEYLFTDISRSFLNEAQERFKKYPWVKFGLYDINIDYWKQDIPTSYFDVILCNNVLHNANNEVKVLGQFKEIAAPNGNLIIIDATGNNYALMTSIEFLNGLNGVEDFRAENEQIFLQQDQWNKLFKKSDIELLAAFPEEDSTLKVIGQTVFVCKFNSKRRRIDPSEIKNYMANNLPEYMLPSHIEVLKEFPLTANGKIDRNILRNHLDGTLTQTTEQGEAPSTDLEKAIAQIWCDALKKEKIWKNENFYEIGGDSLLVAQVVAKMKEKIEEAKAWDWDKLMIALIESPTIEGISKKLMEGLPSEETKEKQESLIILKQGNNNKALVLIHDGTGTISPYNQVIPFLHSTEGSLLALQCNDMEEYLSVKPEKLIQFLGEKYAKILIDTEKEVYDLVGYCMGGLIALETAKILTEAGKTVHSLISVDTTPSRRMVNNELLMERAFGMIIGADTYKVGHTVEDELLKRAIKELGEKYGDNVSNEELVSLEGEFLPVS